MKNPVNKLREKLLKEFSQNQRLIDDYDKIVSPFSEDILFTEIGNIPKESLGIKTKSRLTKLRIKYLWQIVICPEEYWQDDLKLGLEKNAEIKNFLHQNNINY